MPGSGCIANWREALEILEGFGPWNTHVALRTVFRNDAIMNCGRDQNLEERLFDLARKQPTAAARRAFLDEVCLRKPKLRATLEELLAAHLGHKGFLPSTEGPSTEPSE